MRRFLRGLTNTCLTLGCPCQLAALKLIKIHQQLHKQLLQQVVASPCSWQEIISICSLVSLLLYLTTTTSKAWNPYSVLLKYRRGHNMRIYSHS